MQNKLFKLSALVLCLFIWLTAAAQDSLEGKYTVLKPAQPTQTGNKIEVVEIFWYGCPHCYSFEPFIDDWLKSKPEDVEFIRLPGVLNQSWIPHAKAYYTAEKLGITEKIHRPLFDAIHKEKRSLYTENELMNFFVTQGGVTAGEFTKTYNSKEIDTKIRQAYFLARDYKLTGVPSIVVNGKYMTTGTLTGTFPDLINVMNTLIDTERQAAR